MKLGKREREVLREIELSNNNLLLGFLCSMGSSRQMYKIAYTSNKKAREKFIRQTQAEQTRRRAVTRLAQKKLITLVPKNGDHQVTLTKKGSAWARLDLVTQQKDAPKRESWDGVWTLVMFDMPTNYHAQRVSLVSILKKIGFIQTQMSNYIFPYDVPEIEEFLCCNPKLGTHCQIFRGTFKGDDSVLRKKFKLPNPTL